MSPQQATEAMASFTKAALAAVDREFGDGYAKRNRALVGTLVACCTGLVAPLHTPPHTAQEPTCDRTNR